MDFIHKVTFKNLIPLDDCPGLFYLDEELKFAGITDRYLVHAENDFQNFVNYKYLYGVIKGIIVKEKIDLSQAIVLDLCSGFGNTVIPLLRDFPSVCVVASDLSEGMLRILIRESIRNNVNQRVRAIVCDAQSSIWNSNTADMIIGGAALHHMLDPALTISSAISALKPGGRAIFLEPMELGHCIFALALKEINGLTEMQGEKYMPAFNFLNGIIKDVDARTHHETYSSEYPWNELDDKWVFSKKYLEDIAGEFGSTISVFPLSESSDPFCMQATTCLEQYANLKYPDCLPTAAIDILKKYDSTFSRLGHHDMPLEAALVFTKN